MRIFLIRAIAALSCVCATQTVAQDAGTLGWGLLYTNDILGDREDRWRTGGFSLSHLRGRQWTGALPGTAGEIVELRMRSEIIAPVSLDNPRPGQRRYVGLIGLGAHTHFQRGGIEMNVGVDINFLGPQTKMSDLHEEVHDLVGGPTPRVDNFEIADGIYPTLTFEGAKSFKIADTSTLRPFIEAIAGSETLLRAGLDLTVGDFGLGGLRIRDHVTGHRYKGIYGGDLGVSFLAGADIAYVAESRYLTDPLTPLKDIRSRVRIGMTYQAGSGGVFYGLTYLGREFAGQSEGQVVGALNVSLRF